MILKKSALTKPFVFILEIFCLYNVRQGSCSVKRYQVKVRWVMMTRDITVTDVTNLINIDALPPILTNSTPLPVLYDSFTMQNTH